ncbi:MAG: hypothetical protein B7Y45_12340 [Sphingomonas sp. 28-66-16]|nr:MAG: hypothetical protein B7Y45_12340 [Sphingomonas sp. 28-66-16]
MKFRLAVIVFAAIAATSLIGAIAMAGALSINLKQGFNAYLEARDRERLEGAVAAVIDAVDRGGGPDAIDRGTLDLALAVKRAVRVPLRLPPPPPRDDAAPGAGPPPRSFGPPERFEARLILLDRAGRALFGPPLPPRDRWPPHILRHDLVIGGKRIGALVLLPRSPAPRSIDARFLASQYRTAGFMVLALMLLSLLPAWIVARAGARMVAAIKASTGAIAQGRYDQPAPASAIREVSAVTDDINQMAGQLDKLQTARRRWLAEISHELRTPLAGLRGEVDALVEGIRPLTPAAIESIHEEVGTLGRLVEDLHFLAVSDLSGPACTFAPADAIALCRAVVSRFAGSAHQAGLSLRLGDEGPSSVAVVWDGRRIDQVLANVLTNSLRYTDPPGTIVVAVTIAHDVVQLSIADSAPGVPDEALHALFDPLYRLDATRDRATGGSGLGLSVSASIVAAHRGRIEAAPSALGGVAIVITLPIDARAA